MFSKKDIIQIEKKGLTLKKVQAQIQVFRNGLPFVNIKEAATIGNGILKLKKEEETYFTNLFESNRNKVTLLKFVPASGAATRMFKFLFEFLKEYDPEKESINAYINKNKAMNIMLFFVGMEKFPFYNEVHHKTKSRLSNYEKLSNREQQLEFIKTMLDEEFLNLSHYPKGLLPFHAYKGHNASAFEEHLFEAALYAVSNGKANLHFTISEKHQHKFDGEYKRIAQIVENKTQTQFNLSFSFQKESTDTIAVTPDYEPLREEGGRLVFRPAGHGALIENLNDQNADVIFLKNIDNVVVFKYEKEVAYYKKTLAGMLLEVQKSAFKYMQLLDTNVLSENDLVEIAQFLSNKLNVFISSEFEKYSTKYQVEYLREKLNRPIRVCGMVKNEGEPGGGPFWIKDESSNISLQIVESAQIDKKNKMQKNIMKNATHFNPVDLVCGIKNYKGETFDLLKFVDAKTAFITDKTKSGKSLKALELPGLWNGAMGNWNTIFVEVPLLTFNPVKTINDLLKAPHQINAS